MTLQPQISNARTRHARHGDIDHQFEYGVDMIWFAPEIHGYPRAFGLARVRPQDYGSKLQAGAPTDWVRQILTERGLSGDYEIWLLTQPRVMGRVFNPVSFWVIYRLDMIVAFIAEVNNTFHERHSYLCHNENFTPIGPNDVLTASKAFYVSPFQEIAGEYRFSVEFGNDGFAVRINFVNGNEGVLATLNGRFAPVTQRRFYGTALRRPFASLRVSGLIYWHALKLKLKGARYRTRPETPTKEVS